MEESVAMTRDLNDRLFGLLRDLRSSSGDFSCECGDNSCRRSVELTLGDYETMRVHRGEPLLSPDHD